MKDKVLLEKILKIDRDLLKESIDSQDLKKISSIINSLQSLAKEFNLPELELGVQKAADELSSDLGSTLSKFLSAGQDAKVRPKTLAKVLSLQTSILKGLKQLPDIFDIVTTLKESSSKIVENDDSEDKFINNLSNKQSSRIRALMLRAFSPPGFLAMFRGMPWVNDKKLIDEILNLSTDRFIELINKSKKMSLNVPVEKNDLSQIAKRIRDGNSERIEIEKSQKKVTSASALSPKELSEILEKYTGDREESRALAKFLVQNKLVSIKR